MDEDKQKNPIRGQVYTLNAEEVDNSKDLIQGMGHIKSKHVSILLDSSATHSFISVDCTKRVYFSITKLLYEVIVSTPSDEKICTTSMCSPVFFDFQGKTFCLDLYCLQKKGLDVILGIDWLNAHKVRIDCATRIVHILDGDLEICFMHNPTFHLQNLFVLDDGPRFLIVFMTDLKNPMDIDPLLIVWDFLGVFHDDIESLPPKREVEFSIELIPRAGPISKARYKMALLELAKVKQKVEGLFQK
jgi:hypothetical protein